MGKREGTHMNRSVLVWGGYGFIGSNLVKAFQKQGHRVSVLVRRAWLGPTPEWARGIRTYELNRGDENSVLRQAIGEAEIIYNLAGSCGAAQSNADPLSSLDENCANQLKFLEACAEVGTRPRVVFSSSRLVYGSPDQVPVDEMARALPNSMYAIHKLTAELYHALYGRNGAITYTICRISNPFGFHSDVHHTGYRSVINCFIDRAREGKPIVIYGDGSQVRDYIYIDDLVKALTLCGWSEYAANKVFNVGTGVGVSMREAAQYISDVFGGAGLQYQPWPESAARVETGDYVSDIGKLRNLLRFEASYDFRSAIDLLSGMIAPREMTPLARMVPAVQIA